MASVTFSTGVGGDGSTVTDDTNATTGLDAGGHRTRFVPALAQIVAIASYVINSIATIISGSAAFAAEVDVASATTCDIGAAASVRIRITGTATITSLGTGTNKFRLVRFAAGLTLTHNGTSLILPDSVNITTQASDTCIATSDGSGNWRVLQYTRKNKPLIAAYISTSPANVTGDATGYTIIWDAVFADRGSNLNLSTGVFTAPVTGLYRLGYFIATFNDSAAATRRAVTITTTARNYIFDYGDLVPDATSSGVGLSNNLLIPMTAGDTLSVAITIDGTTKTIGLAGGSAPVRTTMSIEFAG